MKVINKLLKSNLQAITFYEYVSTGNIQPVKVSHLFWFLSTPISFKCFYNLLIGCITFTFARFIAYIFEQTVIQQSFSTFDAQRHRKREKCCKFLVEEILWFSGKISTDKSVFFLTAFTSSSCVLPIWLHSRALSLGFMQCSLFVLWRWVNHLLNVLCILCLIHLISCHFIGVLSFFFSSTCSPCFLCMSCGINLLLFNNQKILFLKNAFVWFTDRIWFIKRAL